MPRPSVLTVSSAGPSPVYPTDYRNATGKTSLAYTPSSAGASLIAKAQYTLDELNGVANFSSVATWFDHPDMSNLTSAAVVGNLAFPVRAVRLVVTTHVGGAGVLTIIQAGT